MREANYGGTLFERILPGSFSGVRFIVSTNAVSVTYQSRTKVRPPPRLREVLRANAKTRREQVLHRKAKKHERLRFVLGSARQATKVAYGPAKTFKPSVYAAGDTFVIHPAVLEEFRASLAHETKTAGVKEVFSKPAAIHEYTFPGAPKLLLGKGPICT